MLDQCLKILLMFGSFSAVARGEDYDYYEYDGYSTTTTSTTSRPTSTAMTTTSQPTTTRRSAGDNECYAGDFDCEWENDPSASQIWSLTPWSLDAKLQTVYRFKGEMYRDKPSLRGNSSIRMISPIFTRDSNYSCISIIFKMHLTYSKSGIVGLRGYQKPVHIALRDLMAYSDEAKKDYIIFEAWGEQDVFAHYPFSEEFPLKHFDSNFQIILEGIFGEDSMEIKITYIALKQRTKCRGNTTYPIPRQTTSTTISTTTTMSTTTTERAMGENGDTITDKVTKSDTWVDASTLSDNPWPTTTWPTTLPTTKQPTTTQSLQERNGFDSRNTQIIISLIATLGIVLLIFASVLAVVLACKRGTHRLNDSSFIDHEKQPSDARYSTKNGGDVCIDGINSTLNN